MGIRVSCDQCKAAFVAKDEHAGRKGKCPKCGAVLRVPLPTRPTADASLQTPVQKSPAVTTKVASKPSLPANLPPTGDRQSPAKQGVKNTGPVSREQLQSQLKATITGPIKPVRTSFLYQLGLIWSAVVMILLPVVYLGLIALAAWAVYYHATNHVGMMGAVRGRGVIIMIALYAAPIIAGGIMILFMIKPLFAAPADEGRTRFLTRQGEPVLFEFVDQLCASVGAPLPRRIEVDNALNASASYGRGWRGLFGGDLVLTIGAPLAAGLSLEQFAGVLAHEFGHFSQGMGMRMTFIVRSISHWFVRVVYQRDEWDAWLAESHEDTDWRWAIVMLFAQFAVWLSRRVLWVLMYIGHLVAGFLLRQMEYDADLHATRFVGSEAFESTSLRVRTLGKTYEAALKDLVGHLNQGRLPDNLSKMILSHAEKLPPGAVARQREALEKEKTGLFDSHPCDRQRIAAMRKENSPGVFHFAGPAALLFSNFDATCRSVTGDFYRGLFGSRFDAGSMHPTEALLTST